MKDDENNKEEALNLEYLKELSGGNKTFEVSMIEQFLRQTPGELELMIKEFNQKNYIAVAQIAHNIKTSVSFMGLLETLGDKLDYVEINASAQRDNGYLKENITAIKDTCEKAFRAAEQYLKHIA
jgi:hypothetical protein